MRVFRTVGRRGQVTIPKEVRELLKIEQGDIVEIAVIRNHDKDQTSPEDAPAQAPSQGHSASNGSQEDGSHV